MKTISSLIALLPLSLLIGLTGCQTQDPVTRSEAFPIMYTEQPHVLVVLPPINLTTSADAKEYYATTIAEPLNQRGFYVVPVEVVTDILESQGLTDTELYEQMPMRRFGEAFGADAVLFTRIHQWDKNYMVLSSTLVIQIEAYLKSTRTDQELWRYTGTIVADLSGGSSSSGNLLADLIAQAVVSAIATAAADYVDYANLANNMLLSSMPVGRYHSLYLQDRDTVVPNGVAAPAATPAESEAPAAQPVSEPTPAPEAGPQDL